mmetsp:Transcript_81372/g.212120  ORF Transcript_81372/g.212120 Transcript_81372/m.212120 type:complete len:499 (+) Transcript_81372:89-1585(+)
MAAGRLSRHLAATCAASLGPLERDISLGLRGRLPALSSSASGGAPAPRVAIIGPPSVEFAAALRAARSAGAAVALLDLRNRAGEDLSERLAEAQVHLAILAGTDVGSPEGKLALNAARRLGASTASVAALQGEGASAAVASAAAFVAQSPSGQVSAKPREGAPGDGGASLLLFSAPPRLAGPARAAQVGQSAVEARVAEAVRFWGLVEIDTVLPIGLASDQSCSVVDALEAPLAAGCRVALPVYQAGYTHGFGSAAVEAPSEMWASIVEAVDATVIMISAESLRHFLDAYHTLAPGLRADLALRSRARPVRLSVAFCSPGTVPSRELSERWNEIFACPLTWHFSCAEAGSLYSVGGSVSAGLDVGVCAEGLEWQVEDDEGELGVRGEGLFHGYQGRPRSTLESFDEAGFFLRTGHRVTGLGDAGLRPEPTMSEPEVAQAAANLLRWEPNVARGASMRPEWREKKVYMRKYLKWRTRWGAVLLTKKHNQAHQVYDGKYK